MIKKLNALELSKRLPGNDRLYLVDVRSPLEYSRAHIPGAISVPLQQLTAADLKAADGRPIVFICQVGARSQTACELALSWGVEDVYNLSDGTKGWIEAGLPCE